ncbi:hypothetical protein KUTeg_021822 [Tegillarca granosa]|uniref:Sodium-coupled monocarboxylate transporter 1 n=1 Tax=Tegillarca granosa TaxID=220873 RepID=A0ABQ9E4G3_TEGGR|nr:hypothetical protein KUTeg_021822 [Tegillarca granosa]
MATTFTVLDYCLFVAVLCVSALIGIYYLLKEKWQTKQATSEDILMGGRDMPVFPVAMSLVASYMSAITVLGIPTEMYVFGTEYWLVALSGLMTYPVTCHIFLPFFHNLHLASAYQYLELRFNRATRYLASAMFALETLLYMAVVLYAPALALNQVTGLSLWGSILSVGAVVTFYTSMGGLKAVLWTDTFQTLVVIGSLIGVIAIGSAHLGGLGEVWRIADLGGRIEFSNFDLSPFTRCTFWGLTIGSFIGQLTIYGANQTMLQRYMSIRNVKNAQISLYISLPATLLLVSIVCLSGLVIYASYYTCDPFIDVGGLLVVALAFLCSLLGTTVLQIMITVLGIAGGPLLALFLMGMFFPCVNAKGAIFGFLSSAICVFWIAIGSFIYEAPLPMLPFRSDGCTVNDHVTYSSFNLSARVIDLANHHQSGIKMIYTISFLWYPTVAIVIALINGIFVSWITGWRKDAISPRFIYPVTENLCCILPNCILNCLDCHRLWTYNVSSETHLLSDDDDEDDVLSTHMLKKRNRETARLLPSKTNRMDSFETEITTLRSCRKVCELCPGEPIGEFVAVDYVLFAAVLAISALIGVFYMVKEARAAKQATADDVLMGGRDIGIFPIAMSLMASFMSAITVLGTPTEMYNNNTSYWIAGMAMILTVIVTNHVFLPFFHNLNLTSAYELLYMGVVLYAPSLALNQVTGLSLELSIVAIGLVCTFYTALGGLRAVVWTDTFQTFVVMAGLIAIIVQGSIDLGGFEQVWNIADTGGRIHFIDWDADPTVRHSIWALIIGSFVGQLTIYAANQTMIQRYLAIKEIKNSQRALYVSLPLTLILSTVVCLVGLVIYSTYHDCDPYIMNMLLPFLVMDKLTFLPGLPGLFVACLFSASLSSISSGLNALAIVILEDIFKLYWEWRGTDVSPTWMARIAKLLGLLCGGLVIGIAFLSRFLGQTVLQIMLSIFGMVGGPLLGLFISGIFFPWINSAGALCGLIVSAVMAFWVGVGGTVVLPPPPIHGVSAAVCDVIQRNCSSLSNNNTGVSTTLSSTLISTTMAATTSTPSINGDDIWIYHLSYLWYGLFAVLISLIVGIVVTLFSAFFTDMNESEDIEPHLIHSVVDRVCCYLPLSCQRVHRFRRTYYQFLLKQIIIHSRKKECLDFYSNLQYQFQLFSIYSIIEMLFEIFFIQDEIEIATIQKYSDSNTYHSKTGIDAPYPVSDDDIDMKPKIGGVYRNGNTTRELDPDYESLSKL